MKSLSRKIPDKQKKEMAIQKASHEAKNQKLEVVGVRIGLSRQFGYVNFKSAAAEDKAVEPSGMKVLGYEIKLKKPKGKETKGLPLTPVFQDFGDFNLCQFLPPLVAKRTRSEIFSIGGRHRRCFGSLGLICATRLPHTPPSQAAIMVKLAKAGKNQGDPKKMAPPPKEVEEDSEDEEMSEDEEDESSGEEIDSLAYLIILSLVLRMSFQWTLFYHPL
ncbi:nucleolin [Manis pentadactyla]|nr:nucleolin [Manis pentadactyla]